MSTTAVPRRNITSTSFHGYRAGGSGCRDGSGGGRRRCCRRRRRAGCRAGAAEAGVVHGPAGRLAEHAVGLVDRRHRRRRPRLVIGVVAAGERPVGVADLHRRWRRAGRRASHSAHARSSGHGATAAPVLASAAVQQPLVDEVPPQHRGVGMARREQLVHLALGVAHTGLELLHHPVEQHQPLRAGRRERRDPAVARRTPAAPGAARRSRRRARRSAAGPERRGRPVGRRRRRR